MNGRRTLAVARRIADQFRRDHRTMALLFVAPLAILALFGWVIRDQTPPPTRLAVVNLGGAAGEVVRSSILGAAEAGGIVVDAGIDDVTTARDALAADDLDVAVVLPETLAGDVAAGRPAELLVVTQGLTPADDAGRVVELQAVLAEAFGRTPPVTITVEPLYGSPDADLLDTFASAFLAYIGYFLVFILTGISFLRERVGGTLERLLATPIRRAEMVAGYSAGFGFFATLQVAVILAFALGSLDVPAIGPLPAFTIGLGVSNAGSPAMVFLVMLLLALGAVNLGIFISTFARTELQVLQFIPIVLIPQGLLAGIFWPIDSLPDALEAVARLLPLTYAVDGLRQVLLKGADLGTTALQIDLAVLAGIAVVLVVLAAATIRREVA
jgi:ABC-2 type transport system permease protein